MTDHESQDRFAFAAVKFDQRRVSGTWMNSGRSTLDFVINDSCSLVASSKCLKLTDINAISIARVDSWHAEYAFEQFLIHGIDLASAYATIFVKTP